MEFHLPQQPIRSLRDVVTHLGVITLGILIALGLEQCVAARHRASLAAEAIAGFRRELTDNRAEVQEVVSKMPELRAQIQAQIAQLTALAAPGAGIAPPIKYPGIDFNLVSTASWDTAVATQALNEIPYEKAKGYVEAYGVLRLFLQEEQFTRVSPTPST